MWVAFVEICDVIDERTKPSSEFHRLLGRIT